MPLKAIVSKCVVDWQFDGDVSIVNMGYGLSVTKFPNAVDCNRVLDGQPWFWKLREGGGGGVNLYRSAIGSSILIQSRRILVRYYCRFVSPESTGVME